MKKEELTTIERQILMNQEMILAKLYPEDEKHHEWKAKVFQLWIEGTYEFNLEPTVSKDVFDETNNILNMFLDIDAAIKKLSGEEKASLDLDAISYEWFDPHWEHIRVINYHRDRAEREELIPVFREWVTNNDRYLNQIPMSILPKYSRMYKCFLEEWSVIRYNHMVKEGLQALINAANNK